MGAQSGDCIDSNAFTLPVPVTENLSDELAVPAWNGAITQEVIERVQKAALHIILGDNYVSYRTALQSCNLTSLESRREKLLQGEL